MPDQGLIEIAILSELVNNLPQKNILVYSPLSGTSPPPEPLDSELTIRLLPDNPGAVATVPKGGIITIIPMAIQSPAGNGQSANPKKPLNQILVVESRLNYYRSLDHPSTLRVHEALNEILIGFQPPKCSPLRLQKFELLGRDKHYIAESYFQFKHC